MELALGQQQLSLEAKSLMLLSDLLFVLPSQVSGWLSSWAGEKMKQRFGITLVSLSGLAATTKLSLSLSLCLCGQYSCAGPCLPGRHDEALAIAERGRTRAFADLLVERQRGSRQAVSAHPYIPVTVEDILEMVNSQKAMILYYSLAGGFLYSWLICPGTGIMKFNEVYLGEAGPETSEFQDGGGSPQGGGTMSLDQYIFNAREALGVDSHQSRVCSSSETESEAGDLMDQRFEGHNSNLTSSADPTGYLRMVSINNQFNRRCRSMTSLYSATVSPVKDGLSSPLCRPSNIGKPPLRALYDLLIAPMESVCYAFCETIFF